MTVTVQPNLVTNVTKYRPCINLSRHVNKFIKDFPVKFDDLTQSWVRVFKITSRLAPVCHFQTVSRLALSRIFQQKKSRH